MLSLRYGLDPRSESIVLRWALGSPWFAPPRWPLWELVIGPFMRELDLVRRGTTLWSPACREDAALGATLSASPRSLRHGAYMARARVERAPTGGRPRPGAAGARS